MTAPQIDVETLAEHEFAIPCAHAEVPSQPCDQAATTAITFCCTTAFWCSMHREVVLSAIRDHDLTGAVATCLTCGTSYNPASHAVKRVVEL